jgi:chemotaxis protein histidine kinase CheA
MSSLTIAQITALIAQMRNAADILEGSLVPAANKAATKAAPSEQPARKERSDKGKSRSKKPAADEEPPEEAPKAAKEPKARKPNAWQDFVKLSGGVIKASAAKKADPDSYDEFVENWNAENPVPTKSAAPKKAPAPKPKAKVVPLLPASDDEGEAQQHELVNIEGVNYWLDTDMNMLFQDEEGEPGDFAHFYRDGEIVNHL